ncbi:MFS transporter [Sodalis praecaptivus]|uniref:MFS transporter n=1 Tax=Sodalis praecaptivus TaxID=1239307 RepID=UPI0027F833BE|nr:MFS transporter [Sodalis praecaptivus]CAJ0991914.1 putative MFS-type transporter YfcJ [Sodalis praecaptivus]
MTKLSRRDAGQVRLWILSAVLFVSYLCVAIPLPVVPVFTTRQLGLSNSWAGLAVGVAFFSTLLTRGRAGALSDAAGSKSATRRGLLFYGAGAFISALAGVTTLPPLAAYLILILVADRLLVGWGESLVGVGIITWGIGLAGPAQAGKVLAIVGAAIYGALAVGGPLGLVLLNHVGFLGVMAVSVVLPCVGILAIVPLAEIAPAAAPPRRAALYPVLGRIWRHGLIVCLQGVGFAILGAFFSLLFLHREWAHAGFGITAFGAGFVLVRLCLGHLPDTRGALPVATVSLAVEAVGQLLLWGTPEVALVGALMTGIGCSLIFPAMGREVVHQVPADLRGTAMGGFSAFQDLAYGLSGPVAGVLADRAGYDSVFLLGATAAGVALAIAAGLWRAGARSSQR